MNAYVIKTKIVEKVRPKVRSGPVRFFAEPGPVRPNLKIPGSVDHYLDQSSNIPAKEIKR